MVAEAAGIAWRFRIVPDRAERDSDARTHMIKTIYLEIHSPDELRPPANDRESGAALLLRRIASAHRCCEMYAEVGKLQYWKIYRWGWDEEDWRRYLQRPDIEAWMIERGDGVPVGYLELQHHEDRSIEILIFGILPDFIGCGIGGRALALVTRHCLDRKPARVWLHTCSLDHPAALKNYYARGFKFVREEVSNVLVLEERPSLLEPGLADTCLAA